MALATTIQGAGGWRFYRAACRSLRAGAADRDALFVLGASLAYGFGFWHPPFFVNSAWMITFALVGWYLENDQQHKVSGILDQLPSLTALQTLGAADSRDDTFLTRMLRHVREAQASRAPIQILLDRMATWFVPAIAGLSALTFFLGWGVGGAAAEGLTHAITILVVASPAALTLAIPTVVSVGIGMAACRGIFFRNGEALQRAAKVSVVVFAKRGALTQGRPVVSDVAAPNSAPVLLYAASAEASSEHPVGRAIVQAAREKNLELLAATSFEAVPGYGVKAVVGDRWVIVGKPGWFIHMPNALKSQLKQWEAEGKTVTPVAFNDEMEGLIALSDALKPDAEKTVQTLRDMGQDVWLVTGDNKKAAEVVAKQCGITLVRGETAMQDKAKLIATFQKDGKRVVMVSEGLRDSSALAQADVGIALGMGTELKFESAGIALPENSPWLTVTALRLSKASFRTLKENLFLVFFYHLIAIPLAAMGWISPVGGTLAMSLAPVLVIGNALRLRRKNF
jgi:Cu+-exporting ATPase